MQAGTRNIDDIPMEAGPSGDDTPLVALTTIQQSLKRIEATVKVSLVANHHSRSIGAAFRFYIFIFF